jgi:hypothetical protein
MTAEEQKAYQVFVSGVRSGIPLKESDYKSILAADAELTALRAELDNKQRSCDVIVKEYAALRAEVAVLEKVAEWAGELADGVDIWRDYIVYSGQAEKEFKDTLRHYLLTRTLDALKKTRTALAALKEGK